jgi:hypothetical protein
MNAHRIMSDYGTSIGVPIVSAVVISMKKVGAFVRWLQKEDHVVADRVVASAVEHAVNIPPFGNLD